MPNHQEKLILIDQRLQEKQYKSQDQCFVIKKIYNSTSFKINQKLSLGTVDDLINSGRWVVEIVNK